MTALYFREYNVSGRVVETRAILMRRKCKKVGSLQWEQSTCYAHGSFSVKVIYCLEWP